MEHRTAETPAHNEICSTHDLLTEEAVRKWEEKKCSDLRMFLFSKRKKSC